MSLDGRGVAVAATMLIPCEECGHGLWSEVRASGAFWLVVHFDDDARSPTYAEHVPRCPGCGVRLDRGALASGIYPPVSR